MESTTSVKKQINRIEKQLLKLSTKEFPIYFTISCFESKNKMIHVFNETKNKELLENTILLNLELVAKESNTGIEEALIKLLCWLLIGGKVEPYKIAAMLRGVTFFLTSIEEESK